MAQPIPVYKYDLQGNLLAAYDSINLAAIKNGRPFSSVRQTARGKYKFSGDYIFSFERHTKIKPYTRGSKYEENRKRFKPIVATKGNRRIEFESISECAKFIGCHRSAISQMLNPASGWKYIYGWAVQELQDQNK